MIQRTLTQKRQIQAAMALKGITFSAIAKKQKVSRQFVSQVFNNTRKTKRIRVAIAKATGMRVEDLFPDARR